MSETGSAVPLVERMRALSARTHKALSDLVEPARAAAAQMQDAGMASGAGRLMEALFQYDAVLAETQELIDEHPSETLAVVIGMLGKQGSAGST